MTQMIDSSPTERGTHRLERMFGARSVALVGASARAGSVGAVTLEQLVDGGYTGEIYPVNPRYRDLHGRACFPSLSDISAPVDLAVIAVPDSALVEQLQAAADIGVRAAVVFGGFSAVAGDGGLEAREATLAQQLGRIARDADMALCGPNGMGFVDLERRLRACGYFEPLTRRAGSISFISHSGSVFSAMLHNDRGLEFNLAVSAGQEAAVTAGDYLAYALTRDSTEVVGLFLETIRDPTNFRAALDLALQRDVPVVALKVGGSPQASELVRAHSGGLAGDDGAYEALFDAYGVTRVRSLDEMVDTLELFASGRRAGPGGLATVHDSGGERAHLADVASDAGVPFSVIGERTRARLTARLDLGLSPSNPLDAWGTGRDFAAAFHDHALALHDDPDTSVVVLALDLTTETEPEGGYLWTARQVLAETTKPVAVVANLASGVDRRDALYLREAGVPVLQGTRTGLAAVGHLLRRRDVLARRPLDDVGRPPSEVRQRWRRRLDDDEHVGEAEVLDLLNDYGIPVAEHRLAGDTAGAVEAASQVGWPVVLKTAAPGIEHKSEVDGVRLDLGDVEQVAAAYADLAERLGPEVLVSRMAAPAPELALGMVHDPQMGPVLVVAAGGTLAELLHDRQVALPPLDVSRAHELLDRLAVRPVLDGVRGRPPAQLDAVVDAIVRFSVLVEDLGDLITAMDVNPLLAGADGCVAVDGLVVRAPTPIDHPGIDFPGYR